MDISSIFQRVLTRLLSPLVRYLISQNWTYPALCELLKKIYIAETVQHYREPNGKAITDSRVSLLTGIHRKDVKRLREELAHETETPLLRRGAGLAVRTVSTWVSQHCDAEGNPIPLPFREEGNTLSFEALVRELKADMRAKSILDELIHAGVAELNDQGEVTLLRHAYISDLPEDKLAFLGDNIGDHLGSALHNISRPDCAPMLERAVFFNSLPADALEPIKQSLASQGDQILRDAHGRMLAAKAAQAKDQPVAQKRVRFGVYYFEEDNDAQP